MLKKAGIVVLGATAGMLSLAPLASAGEAGHHHDEDRSHSSSSDCGASAVQGGQANTGNQLVGVNNTNVQAPINQLGVLSSLDSDCDDDEGRHHGGRHHHKGGDDHDHDHDRDRDRDRDDDGGGARAVQRGQLNTGDQLIGINNTNVQVPINQLGILSNIDG
ncbi:hypothetical protein [Actinomycetospora lemnae]|uniref:Small secreted domain DUF320 n=1 Tax=Actinomycetospora lemnae TaxID=3019891 RepID=A0ABT5SVP3_9PSEU|nr:hypothetical protein [Actinomycetospora sp. DW7H6]MDD7966927.1 hypothetical protein [Actinomycetospora sp. DW7H6]